MSKTAIVPVEPCDDMRDAGAGSIPYVLDGPRWQLSTRVRASRNVYVTMLKARPAVPDEVIEEAAKAMQAADSPHSWDEIPEYEHDEYRNMARAAARVFNGGN